MSKFIKTYDLKTGRIQHIYNDLQTTATAISDFINDENIKITVLGSTYYLENSDFKAIVCINAKQAKKAWATTGLSDDLRPSCPFLAYQSENDANVELLFDVAKFIFWHK